MSINFPNSPNLNDIAQVGNSFYIWNGRSWVGYTTSSSTIGIKDDDVFSGAAATINFGNNLTVDFSDGVATIDATGGGTGGGESYWTQTSSGIHTLSNVGIGTTNPTSALTVKGNTSLETLSVSGVSTLTTLSIGGTTGSDGQYLRSTGNGLTWENFTSLRSVYNYSATESQKEFTAAGINTGFVDVYLNGIRLDDANYSIIGIGVSLNVGAFDGDEVTVIGFNTVNASAGGGIGSGTGGGESYWEQTSAGIHTLSNVGIGTTNPTSALTVSGNARFTGIVTASSFGNANASSLNVSGIATISQGRIQANGSANLRFGNVPAGTGSSGRNIAIGDQVLVSLSGGQGRNIGIGELSYYDTTTGQYNIGIGERAGQKVTTGAYNVVLGAYDGNSGGLDIRTSSRNVVIADGEGNIRQYINSSGNVGIKTTVVTEALTVAGIVSATGFYGTLNAEQLTGTLPAIDGSALIGVVATGTGVEVQSDGSPVGTAATINFGDNLTVDFSNGIASINAVDQYWTETSAGIHTLSNVGIGTTNPQYKLHVVGSFGATTKSFIIDHPTKVGKKLQHGSLEGPENGVYVRGRSQNTIIELPDYWNGLVDEDTITVNLTPIGDSEFPRVRKIENNKIEVFSKKLGTLDYYFTVFGERKDVEKLEVEF